MIDITEAPYIVRLLKLAATRRYSTPTAIYAQRHSINKKLSRLQQLGVEAPEPGSGREYPIECVVEDWLAGESISGSGKRYRTSNTGRTR